MGIREDFPLTGARSLYGMTKLAAELMIEEYADAYGFRFIINRCGVITGPWQMGKTDQGVFGHVATYPGRQEVDRRVWQVRERFALSVDRPALGEAPELSVFEQRTLDREAVETIQASMAEQAARNDLGRGGTVHFVQLVGRNRA